MKSLSSCFILLSVIAFSATAFAASPAEAQYHPDYGYDRPPAGEGGYGMVYPYMGGGMTPSAGKGVEAAGVGSMAAGVGQGQLYSAEAAQARAQAQSEYIANVGQKQEENIQYQQNMQKFASEQSAESAKQVQAYLKYYEQLAAGQRLTPQQFDRSTNVIHWPYVLRGKEFDDVRFQIDKLFDERTPTNSGMGSAQYSQIEDACQQMDDILKKNIKTYAPMAYITAKHFINSLSYEARFSMKQRAQSTPKPSPGTSPSS